jgi:hypothetical protein
MLKNKKAVYILIPLNLAVWGFFIYRFYSAYTDSDMPLAESKSQTIKLDGLKDSVTYKLSMEYKDPFLKETKREFNPESKSNNLYDPDQQTKKASPAKPPVTVPPKQAPDVKYLGLIRNNTSGLSTALVSVNGQSKLIKQNEAIEGIVFKSFNKDSLVARWGKERIVVRK